MKQKQDQTDTAGHAGTSIGKRGLLHYERQYWSGELDRIAGVDEVGRGCLFGDVVAAAVILPRDLELEGVDDSKKLSEKKREALYEAIMNEAVAVGIGYADADVIDRINIKQASRMAMRMAVSRLDPKPQQLFIDAEKIDCDTPQLALIKGDAISQSIAAASIVAKITRDRMCMDWDKLYPGYGIAVHKGYATAYHRRRILELGTTPMHRRSFLGNILNEQQTLF